VRPVKAKIFARDALVDEARGIASSGNVFADLGFDDAQAQTAAAAMLRVGQACISDLARGEVKKLSLILIMFAAKLGKPARITLAR